ncbi:hypothetical protein RchiOBHm_Chr4g0393981 [Rosa chinensis]|uniref:Uncharacterized protein n=1 Tax=Rosa chinensis TaxID=74649 RepID=A0A2P6QR47_ROSCH|nr:hypothetical protein RchiOBHm_Chr4g0393981 [Rosa chinensis]
MEYDQWDLGAPPFSQLLVWGWGIPNTFLLGIGAGMEVENDPRDGDGIVILIPNPPHCHP